MKNEEVFTMMLNDARVKNYAKNKLTLTFDSVYKISFFEQNYKTQFEELASKLFGENISVITEGRN